ncbi:hypothetical protein BZG36_02437 [Bifiguratus adelaidae]|uniref:Peptidase A1 domain-containing protein n=1 Tax=Bifiguratus adelaidae TaxID=1938954 RepID=A0A261Y3R5_9FUNG|nr:hypothetical protein BZG36_02437 [Bifiguratus adelaidae]
MKLLLPLVVVAATAQAAVILPPSDDRVLKFSLEKRGSGPLHMSRSAAQALGKRADSASLFNDYGSAYLVNVTIGTPGQTFQVALDTGSADLWIPGTACPTTQCPYARFDSTKSSTFKNTTIAFQIQYGTGSALGTYATDTVQVAGATVQNQQFAVTYQTDGILTQGLSGSPSSSQQSSQVNPDGILGFGYPGITASAQTTAGPYNPFVFNLYQSKVITQTIFAVFLNNQYVTGNSGEITLGGTDSSKYTGNINYVTVQPTFQSTGSSQYGYWAVTLNSVSMSGNGGGAITFNSQDIIFDTGTTLTYMSQQVVQMLVNAVDSSAQFDSQNQVYVVSCSAASSSGNVTFTFPGQNGGTVTISTPISQLVIPADGAPSPQQSQQCIFGVAPTGSADPTQNSANSIWLLGDSVLRSAYLVFDFGANRIGIASASGVNGSTGGTPGSSSPGGSTTSAAPTLFASNPFSASGIFGPSATGNPSSRGVLLGINAGLLGAALIMVQMFFGYFM